MNNKLFPDFENIINIGEIPTSFENAFTYLEQVLLLRKWLTKLAEVLEIEDAKIEKNTEDINILKSYEHITKIKENPLLLYEQTTSGLFIASLDATQINPEKELTVRADNSGLQNIDLNDKSLIFINISEDEKAKSKVITLFSPNGDGYAYAISEINTETNEVTGKVGHFSEEIFSDFQNSVFDYMTKTNQTIDNINRSLNILNSYGHINKVTTNKFELQNAQAGIYIANNDLLLETGSNLSNTIDVSKGSIMHVTIDIVSDKDKNFIAVAILDGSVVRYGSSEVLKTTGEVVGGSVGLYSYNDIQNRLSELENNPYTLPVASETTLGGVKVGNGLSITEDGVLNNISDIDLSEYQFIKNPFNNKTYLNYKNIKVSINNNVPSIDVGTMSTYIKEWYVNTRKSPNQRLYGTVLDTSPYFNVILSYRNGDTETVRSRYDTACYPMYYKLYTSSANYYQLNVLYPYFSDENELNYYRLYAEIDDTGEEVSVINIQISIFSPTSSDTKYYILTENTTNSLPMLQEMYEMIKENKIPNANYMKGNRRYVYAGTDNLSTLLNKIDIMFMQINISNTNNVKLINYNCNLQDDSIISVNNFTEKTLTIPELTYKFSFDFLFTDDSTDSASNYNSSSYLITGITKSFDVNEIYGELMVKYSEVISGTTYSSVCPADRLKYMLTNVSDVDYSFRTLADGTTQLTLFIRRNESTQPFISPEGLKIENIFINGYFISGTEDVSKSISITKD